MREAQNDDMDKSDKKIVWEGGEGTEGGHRLDHAVRLSPDLHNRTRNSFKNGHGSHRGSLRADYTLAVLSSRSLQKKKKREI